MLFGHIGVCWVRSWQNSLRDSRAEVLSINANIGTRGCDVFYSNQNVQKERKHDSWTYWSVLGAFVAQTHFVTHAANFSQLMHILAHVLLNAFVFGTTLLGTLAVRTFFSGGGLAPKSTMVSIFYHMKHGIVGCQRRDFRETQN